MTGRRCFLLFGAAFASPPSERPVRGAQQESEATDESV
jgi:hypothetical protein